MSDLNTRNKYFDELFSTAGLLWMGQNTNHIPTHPAVQKALVDSGDLGRVSTPMHRRSASKRFARRL